MMNKLVLIGNGFDLAHGLKTKYTDFIIWYLNKAFVKFHSIADYDDGLLKMTRSRSFGSGISTFSTAKEFLDLMDYYSQQGVTKKFNHIFFENLVKNNHKDNWVDIEEKYYGELIKIYREIELPNYQGQISFVEKKVDELNKCFECIKQELAEYLTEMDKESKQVNAEIEKHISSLIESTKNENALNKTSHGIKPAEIHFLNFNYTSTIEEYIDKNATKDFCKINYIHGKLGDENNPIIFGYGDEMDSYYEKIERLNSNKFLKNIKSFGYFRTSNYQDFSRLIDYKDARFEVHIMGHSCGLSDRILLNSIFEHPNCKSIKIYYYQKSAAENDFFEKTQEISRHFTAKGKEKMRKTIVSFPSSVPLTTFSKLNPTV